MTNDYANAIAWLRRINEKYEPPERVAHIAGFTPFGRIGRVPIELRRPGGGVPRAREPGHAVYVARDGAVIIEPLAEPELIAHLLPARLLEAEAVAS